MQYPASGAAAERRKSIRADSKVFLSRLWLATHSCPARSMKGLADMLALLLRRRLRLHLSYADISFG
jgi:hypothetical protein